ncbi:MAG: 1-acyl-sn-glycerol-3-phosphate acyltransferase [Clostridiales bacterium]|jgi:1-acyl-sn-glycerol-3-phosphate acyltransferase|nr:1-acyl-sn-glycerol-3-phosphate acyltransferase [Clostridiales bacterium]MDN5281767.1 1-acyl-sn-glycerol-3-phosphate acyltransferase [Candidatus Ozemobacter sp.]
MEYALPIMTGLSLAALTGFRAFLPPLVLGLVYRIFPEAVNINEQFAFLAQDPVLICLGIAALFEFLADKIPVVDNFLDWLALPAKILFSGILTYALIPGATHWFYLLVAIVFAEGATLTVHAGKTGIRAASTVTTGGTANPVIGLVEDVISFAGAVAAILLPWLALLLLAYIIYRCLRFLFGAKGGNKSEIAETRPSFIWYEVSQFLSRWFFIIYNRMKINGYEKVPKTGQFVTVANHASIFDGFIMAGAVRRALFIMVKKEAFDNPIKGWYLRKVLCFPVDRSKVDATAIKTAMKVLNDGYNLGLFPEGTRNREGKVSQFKPGAIKFALKKKLPIIPAYIANSHNLTPPGTVFPRPAKMSVHFLDPIDTKAELEAGKNEEDILKMLYDRICTKGTEVMGFDVRESAEESVAEVIEPKPSIENA